MLPRAPTSHTTQPQVPAARVVLSQLSSVNARCVEQLELSHVRPYQHFPLKSTK
jgi:hypothetical protein